MSGILSGGKMRRFVSVAFVVLMVLSQPAAVVSVDAAENGDGEFTIDVEEPNGTTADEVNALIIYQAGQSDPYRKIEDYDGIDLEYTFSNLPTGHEYRVSAYIQDQLAGQTDWKEISQGGFFGGGDSVSATITAESRESVTVQAFHDDDSTPLEDAEMIIESHEGIEWRSGITDEDGIARTQQGSDEFYLYPPGDEGSYTVEISHEGDVVASQELFSLDNPKDLELETSVPPPTYSLSVSSTEGGDVDAEQTSGIEEGETVDIEAEADPNYVFDHWDGDVPSGEREDEDITVTMDEDKELEANFIEKTEVTFTVSKESTIPGYGFSGERIEDAEITVDGVTRFTDDDGKEQFRLAPGEHEYTVTADGFEPLTDTTNVPETGGLSVGVGLVRDGAGGLTVDVVDRDGNGVGANKYQVSADGDQLDLNAEGEAILDAGTYDIKVKPTNSGSDELTEVSKTVTIEEGEGTTVEFTPIEAPTYSLDVDVPAEGGSVSVDPPGVTSEDDVSKTYEEGTEVTVTAEPAEGYEFERWEGDVPANSRHSRKLDLEIDTDHFLHPVFTRETRVSTSVVKRTVREAVEQDGTITVGEETEVGVTLRNDGPKMPIRTVFQFDIDSDGQPEAIDTSGDGEAERVDYDSDGSVEAGIVRGGVDSTVVPTGETQAFGLRYAPGSAGDWQMRVVKQVKPEDEWVSAGTSAWKTFTIKQPGTVAIVRHDPQKDTTKTVQVERTGRDFAFDSASTPMDTGGVGSGELPSTDGIYNVTKSNKYPWTAVGRLTGINSSDVTSRCTATLIEDNHILTAAHCVYEDDREKFLHNFRFKPAQNGNYEPYSYPIEYVQVYKSYTPKGTDPGRRDIAVLTLSRPIAEETGTFAFDSFSPSNDVYGTGLRLTGYPSRTDADYVEVAGSMWHICLNGKEFANVANCTGQECLMADSTYLGEYPKGGTSGGPTWRLVDGEPHVLAVHSGTIGAPERFPIQSMEVRITPEKYADIGNMVRRGNKVDLPPNASLDAPDKVSRGQTIELDASESFDPDGNIDHYEWDLNIDSEFEKQTNDPSLSVSFDEIADNWIVKVRVVDEDGREETESRTLTITPDTPGFQNRAVYVWDYADNLATNTAAQKRFLRRAEKQNLNTVFLSWGSLSNVSPEERAALLRALNDSGMKTNVLIGPNGSNAIKNTRKTIPEVLSYNANRPGAEQFDGIHLDAEPGEADLKPFLSEYQTLLSDVETGISVDGETVQSQDLAVSAAISWWWDQSDEAPQATDKLVESTALDYVVVMAYYDEPSVVRQRTKSITDETDTPYVVAVETQEFLRRGP